MRVQGGDAKPKTHRSQSPLATAAALPPELPPATRRSFSGKDREAAIPDGPAGFTTGPKSEWILAELHDTGIIQSTTRSCPVKDRASLPHAELVHIGFAYEDSAGSPEFLNDGRIERRAVLCTASEGGQRPAGP